MKRTGFPVFVALGWMLASGCAHPSLPPISRSGQAPVPETDRAALFERKCGSCHPAHWVSYGTETKEEWAKLVERKRKMRPGWITGEEAAAIAEYRSTCYVMK